MICQPCRNDYHSGCDDTMRLGAELLGKIPGMAPGTSRWCDCQHEPQDAP